VTDLLRYGRASAALEADPALHAAWATTSDRAVRRAIMRSPLLTADVAEAVVATRRSGMHTLGANPAAPIELLASNPGARRRRAAVDEVLPGGLDEAAARPNRAALVELGSGTVDLVLARAEGLGEATALALAARTDPPLDPWVAAVLVERYGDPAREAFEAHASRSRRAAVRTLLPG
jgi:hypothetical protein